MLQKLLETCCNIYFISMKDTFKFYSDYELVLKLKYLKSVFLRKTRINRARRRLKHSRKFNLSSNLDQSFLHILQIG